MEAGLLKQSPSGADEDDGRDWLTKLADLLLARHLNVSIPEHELRRTLLAGSPEVWKRTERKFRCIAVVGAGASAPVLERGDNLAKGLIKHFGVGEAAVQLERERLERITAVDPREFEAQLAAIGQTLGKDRRVRAAISELYQVRHPTILTYELIAHLLKHRFLDAVINMNFDELLDQSLDDELGVGEYQRIVSDRDCMDIQSNESSADYIPLYIKLHGTASEPESLRYTRESYYDIPDRVGTVAAQLFQIPECVVLNVGFGMGSFDLHRLLAVPDKLRLFNLSRKRLSEQAIEAITRERRAHRKKRKSFKVCQRSKGGSKQYSDALIAELLAKVERQGRQLLKTSPSVVSLRSISRHEAVVGLLGPNSGPGRRLIELPRSVDDARLSLDPPTRAAKPNAVYAGYLRRRAILELALALARGRGLVSVGTLAVDRGGHYYDAYRRNVEENPSSWRELYTLVGFEQNAEVPDVFQAAPEISEEGLENELPRLDLPKLANRVLPHVVDSPSKQDFEVLLTAFRDLNTGTEYELHTRDDRVCAKTFSAPMTLKTISSLDAYNVHLLSEAANGGGAVEVDILSETGDSLLERGPTVVDYLAAAEQIRLIVAFTSETTRLRDSFPTIQLKLLQPWHHNRHMMIVRRNGEAHGALYFARHHRTPYVTPVYVRSRADIRVLQTTFEDRWQTAIQLP